MAYYTQADSEVRQILEDLIEKDHPSLRGVSIACVFRDEPASSGGRDVYAKVEKFPEIALPFAPIQFQFLIWVYKDRWQSKMTLEHKQAMLDKLLCSMWLNDLGKPQILKPDFAGFNANISRYGLWEQELREAYHPLYHGFVQMGLDINDSRPTVVENLAPRAGITQPTHLRTFRVRHPTLISDVGNVISS